MFVTLCTNYVKDINLNKNDTYIIVYTPNYDYRNTFLPYLKERKDIKILFESPLAVNKRQGHGTKPRNKVIVFEYEPDNV